MDVNQVLENTFSPGQRARKPRRFGRRSLLELILLV
jgi:hypothetical protein